MGFECGIVGLPNVGKSTLFNALTATAAAQAANYPFCTIEPNVGRVDAATKKARGNDKEAKALLALMEPVLAALQAGKPARSVPITDEQRPLFKQLQLLTSHPVLYASNVEEAAAGTGNKWSALVAEKAKAEGAATVVISAAIEAEVATLADPAEQREFLASL